MLTEQDKKIIGYIHEAGKGLILFVNKWDTIEKEIQQTLSLKRKSEKDFLLHPMRRFFSDRLLPSRESIVLAT